MIINKWNKLKTFIYFVFKGATFIFQMNLKKKMQDKITIPAHDDRRKGRETYPHITKGYGARDYSEGN